jgi:hypothetical protein
MVTSVETKPSSSEHSEEIRAQFESQLKKRPGKKYVSKSRIIENTSAIAVLNSLVSKKQ